MEDDWLAAFMMSSILLNPQLIIYSAALGPEALSVRLISCFVCGSAAGFLVRAGYRGRSFFNFTGFENIVIHRNACENQREGGDCQANGKQYYCDYAACQLLTGF